MFFHRRADASSDKNDWLVSGRCWINGSLSQVVKPHALVAWQLEGAKFIPVAFLVKPISQELSLVPLVAVGFSTAINMAASGFLKLWRRTCQSFRHRIW